MVIEERINQNSLKVTAKINEGEKSKEKLSSSEQQISHLKAQLHHVSTSKQEEIEKLQKKLGFVHIYERSVLPSFMNTTWSI